MLAYIESCNDLDTSCSSEAEALDYLAGLQSKYAEELLLPESDKMIIKALLPQYKHLYNSKNINLSSTTKADADSELDDVYTTEDIYNSINESFCRGEIDEYDKNALTELICMCEKNVLGELSNESFIAEFDSLVAQWENHYSTSDFSSLTDENGNFKNDITEVPAGAISGVVLNISKSSLAYWDAAETKSVVATIVVQDIVGAVIGGVSGGAASVVVGGGFNWGSVAWGAGVGAITGSTGVVGKTSKWILSVIKSL